MQPNKTSPLLSQPFDTPHKALRFYGAFFLYLTILVIGSIPNARAEVGEFASGFVLHMAAYALITFLLATGSKLRRDRALLQAFLITVVMGALDEYVQSYFPYRHASVQDWLVDGVASSLVACFFWTGSWIKARRVGM